MNELIKELAEQAMGTKKHVPPVWQFYDIELEKFAELIIAECVSVCNNRVGNSDYNTGRMHCASDIKEYFGVK